MMRYILSVAISLLFCLSAKAQEKVEILVNRDSIGSFTKSELISDLDEYKNGIVAKHIDPFTVISKEQFIAKMDSLKARASSYNIDELLIELLKINALINDVHTNVDFWLLDRFPFFGSVFDDEVYLTTTDEINSKYLFSKVIALNDIPVNKAIDRLSAIVATRKKVMVMNYTSKGLFSPDLLHGMHISASREKMKYTIITPEHDTVAIYPKMQDLRNKNLVNAYEKITFYRTSGRGPYWFKDTGKTIFFRYGTCVDNKKNPIANVLKELEHEITTTKPHKLIIDLRDNGGGDPALLKDFIDKLATSYLNTKEGITILIGKRTFSAAVQNAVELKTLTKATFVGEETGGDLTCFGDLKQFDLPATRLKVTYSTKKYEYIKGQTSGLIPDVTIYEKFTDYRKGTDAVLQYAMTH